VRQKAWQTACIPLVSDDEYGALGIPDAEDFLCLCPLFCRRSLLLPPLLRLRERRRRAELHSLRHCSRLGCSFLHLGETHPGGAAADELPVQESERAYTGTVPGAVGKENRGRYLSTPSTKTKELLHWMGHVDSLALTLSASSSRSRDDLARTRTIVREGRPIHSAGLCMRMRDINRRAAAAHTSIHQTNCERIISKN
jgi:hypothetical protein